MKKALLFPLSLVALFILPAFIDIDPPGSLTGRWQKRMPDGNVGIAIFRSDSTYDLSINGKVIIVGKYYIQQDTFADVSGVCRLSGTYRLHFFAEDSVRFTVIQDICRGRREGYNGLTMGRVAPGQAK